MSTISNSCGGAGVQTAGLVTGGDKADVSNFLDKLNLDNAISRCKDKQADEAKTRERMKQIAHGLTDQPGCAQTAPGVRETSSCASPAMCVSLA